MLSVGFIFLILSTSKILLSWWYWLPGFSTSGSLSPWFQGSTLGHCLPFPCREAELKPITFSSLTLFCFPVFPLLLTLPPVSLRENPPPFPFYVSMFSCLSSSPDPSQQYSTFDCCLLGLLINSYNNVTKFLTKCNAIYLLTISSVIFNWNQNVVNIIFIYI